MFNTDLEIGQGFIVTGTSVLSDSYVGGSVFSMDAHNSIGLQVNYIKGSETSMDFKVEVSNNGGNTYAQEVAESTSSGTVTISQVLRTMSSTGNYSFLIRPVRAKLVRVSYKTSGGAAPFGSTSITAYPLWS